MSKINDLNEILFDRLERLNDSELDEDGLQREISKTDAIVKVSDTIIRNAQVALKAQELFDAYGTGRTVNIPLLGISNDDLMLENKRLRREISDMKRGINGLS